jgi:hypothetical protein
VDVLLLIVPPKVISALPALIVTSAFKTTEPLNVIGAPPAVKFEFTLIAVAAEIEIPPVFVESPIAALTVTVSTPVEVNPPLRAPIEVPDAALIVTDCPIALVPVSRTTIDVTDKVIGLDEVILGVIV